MTTPNAMAAISTVVAAVSVSLLVAAVVLGGIAASWIAVVVKRARRERAVLRAHTRAKRARGAALEAAAEDPLFSPEEINRSIGDVIMLAEAMWWKADVGALTGRPDAHLITAWARSREVWLGGALDVVGQPSVDLLQVVNRGDEAEDRVIARVRLHLHCEHPRPFGKDAVGNLAARRHAHLDERWTLGRRGGRWLLLSVDGDPLAGPILTAPLIPTSGADFKRLQEQSLAELADSERTGKDVRLNDLVAADAPPALALLDLSIVDGRFLPALIAAELEHIVEAWEEATTGSERPLAALANPEAIAVLLHPAADKRLILREALLKSWQPTRLDLARRPPAVELAVSIDAVRYVATAAGDYLAGNAEQPHHIPMNWLLELADSSQTLWRLARSNNPAEEVPGWS